MTSPESTKVVPNVVFMDRFTAIYQSIKLSRRSVVAASTSDTVFWSLREFQGRKGLFVCKLTFMNTAFPRRTSVKFSKNSSLLPLLEASLPTAAPCKYSTPSLIACCLHKLFCRQRWWAKSVTFSQITVYAVCIVSMFGVQYAPGGMGSANRLVIMKSGETLGQNASYVMIKIILRCNF